MQTNVSSAWRPCYTRPCDTQDHICGVKMLENIDMKNDCWTTDMNRLPLFKPVECVTLNLLVWLNPL